MTMLAQWFAGLFDGSGFAPHGTCLAWQPGVLWLHIVSDGLIGLAYYSIPAVLAVLLWKRRNDGLAWVAGLFAAFILACGTTHLFGVWTLWNADYYAEGLIKALTAAISIATAAVLWLLLPRALTMPTTAQMTRVNDALHREIVEKEAVAARLSDSERRYASVFDNVAEALMTFTAEADGGFRVEMINPTAATTLGVERAAVVGLGPGDLLPAEAGRRFDLQFRRCRDTGATREFELVLPLGGETLVWHTAVVPLRDPAGAVVKLLVTARDVSERNRLEEEVLQASKLATIGAISAGIAHEVSQPLHAITLWTGIARQRLEADGLTADHAAVEATAVIAEQADRMRAIVDHMRAFSRRDQDPPIVFDAVEAVNRAATFLHRDYRIREVALRIVLPDQAVPVAGRPVLLEQVVVNLLTNALDAVAAKDGSPADAHRTVTVEVRRGADHQAVIAVQDTGGGIPEAVADRLFEPFFTTKAAGHGTGLGLAICRRILRAMRGEVRVTTVAAGTPEAGARFEVTLPLAESAATAAGAPHHSDS
jgi:PAS domain S-box-containing protein